MEQEISQRAILIHLGGLGDLCLSESTIYSISQHFKGNIDALGNRRLLKLFDGYFREIYSIDSPEWLHLFSEENVAVSYDRFIFIGKNKGGHFLNRLERLSRIPPIFIDMFPESTDKRTHVEEHQLLQLARYGIEAVKIVIKPKEANRVILYPEVAIRKHKWPQEKFIELYRSLELKGIPVVVLCQSETDIPVVQKRHISDLCEVREFFNEGGVFVSNDSGMAHLAGLCGLKTITIFIDSDPVIWHPRGINHTITGDMDSIHVGEVEEEVLKAIWIP